MDEKLYTMKQASEYADVSTPTVRYYCKLGLIPNIKYTRAGYRTFSQEQLNWLKTLVFLRRCGFGIADMKHYKYLSEKGDFTITERKAMLETKRRQLWQIIEEAQENINFIERKIEIFEQEQK
jgi:DNA-binding transcriptional MerR regulator